MAMSSTDSKKRQAEMDRYQAEDDFRTLQRADEVTSDSSRMKHVRKHAAKQAGLARNILRSTSRR
jgi:cell division protein FtsL